MASVDPAREFVRATADYERAVAAYVHAETAVSMTGMPLQLADPPQDTQPWTDAQIQAVRHLYRALCRLVAGRKAFEACMVAAYGSADTPRRRKSTAARRRSTEAAQPAAAPSLRVSVDRYNAAVDTFLTAVARWRRAGPALEVAMPAHTTWRWTDEQARALVGHRDALGRLGAARRLFEELQAPVLEARRQAAAEAAATVRRERHRAESRASPEQPY